MPLNSFHLMTLLEDFKSQNYLVQHNKQYYMESTAQWLSFEWSHFRFHPQTQVRTTLYSITNSTNRKALPRSFNQNDHNLEFHPQTQTLVIKTNGSALRVIYLKSCSDHLVCITNPLQIQTTQPIQVPQVQVQVQQQLQQQQLQQQQLQYQQQIQQLQYQQLQLQQPATAASTTTTANTATSTASITATAGSCEWQQYNYIYNSTHWYTAQIWSKSSRCT